MSVAVIIRRDVSGTVVIRLRGEIDLAAAPKIASSVRELRAARTPARLDLSAVSFIDCAGLEVVIGMLRAASAERWPLEVDPAISRRLAALLELTAVRHELLPSVERPIAASAGQ